MLRITSSFILLGSISLSALAACSSPAPEAPFVSSMPVPDDVGAACAFGSQCASGGCSADVSSGGCGVCLEVRGLGQSCDAPLQGCRDSAVCHNGVCLSTKKVAGEPCTLGPKGDDHLHECDDDLCCASTTSLGPGICTARTRLGGACGRSSAPCVRGTYCAPSGTCAIPPADSCVLGPCAAGFFCHKYSTCLPATLPLGAPCGIVDGSFVDNGCMLGTVCGNLDWPQGGGGPGTQTTCVALPGAGEVCIRDQCAQGLFCAEQTTDSTGIVPKRCEPLRAEGEACSTDYIFHIDCGPGLECRNATCAPACR